MNKAKEEQKTLGRVPSCNGAKHVKKRESRHNKSSPIFEINRADREHEKYCEKV